MKNAEHLLANLVLFTVSVQFQLYFGNVGHIFFSAGTWLINFKLNIEQRKENYFGTGEETKWYKLHFNSFHLMILKYT